MTFFRRPCPRGSPEGWYMYADSSNGGYGHTTDFQTPVISSTGPQCRLVFWYYMSGFTVGSLQVRRALTLNRRVALIKWSHCSRSRSCLQVLLKSKNASHEVWSQTGNQGNKWRRGEVFFGLSNNFQVCKNISTCVIRRWKAMKWFIEIVT